MGGSPADVLSKDIGEWADWMPETLHRAYQTMKAQPRNYFGHFDLPKYLETKPLANWKETPNKIVPRERKSWR